MLKYCDMISCQTVVSEEEIPVFLQNSDEQDCVLGLEQEL